MFSSKRPEYRGNPYGREARTERSSQEATLLRREILIERKEFSIALKENPRGRFLRIVEHSGNAFASIIIPISGLADFHKLLDEMTQADGEIPFRSKTAP